jgi:hypothetical protein
MLRRNFITAAGLLIGSSLGGREAIAEAPQSGRDKVAVRLLKAFLSLPGKKSAQIDIDAPRHPWRIAHDPDAPSSAAVALDLRADRLSPGRGGRPPLGIRADRH